MMKGKMTLPRTTKTLTEDDETRDRLMHAASKVVGKRGYKAASIARIAEEANISVGHCYKFYRSREAILDHLILWVMDKFEAYSEPRLRKTKTYLEFEREALDMYFSFQKKNPFFIPILRDSEIETPETYRQFADRRHNRYVSAMESAWDAGQIRGFERSQLGQVSLLISAMRRGIVFHHETNPSARAAAIQAYDVLIQQALGLSPADAENLDGKGVAQFA